MNRDKRKSATIKKIELERRKSQAASRGDRRKSEYAVEAERRKSRATVYQDRRKSHFSPQQEPQPGAEASPMQSPPSQYAASPTSAGASVRPDEDHDVIPRQRPRFSVVKGDEYKQFTMTGASRRAAPEQGGQPKDRLPLSLVLCMVAFVALLVISVGLIVGLKERIMAPKRNPRFVSPAKMRAFDGWAAVTTSKLCEDVPRGIFDEKGTIGEAAVATMLCTCVNLPYRCGLGGGFFAVYYSRRDKAAKAIIARVVAPQKARFDMFDQDVNGSLLGHNAVAVFGELRGYGALLNATGKRLPWSRLFYPAIQLAKGGFRVDAHFAEVIARHAERITDIAFESLRETFMSRDTAGTYKENELFQNPKLAETLEAIARSNLTHDALSKGPLAEAIATDMLNNQAAMTLKDLEEYQPVVEDVYGVTLSTKERIIAPPPPSGGVLTSFVVAVMDQYREEGRLEDDHRNWHRVVEALKHAFARRPELGDPKKLTIKEGLRLLSLESAREVAAKSIKDKPLPSLEDYGYVPGSTDDYGSAQVCIVGRDGDAISLASSINTEFGSMVLSNGILLNNQMNDFSIPNKRDVHGLPAAKNNYIAPGKMPISSLSPVIVVDENGDVIFVGSSTGGAEIPSGLSQVLIRSLWMNHTLKQAIDAGRLHNQLIPDNVVKHENFTDNDVVGQLSARGHKLATVHWKGDVVALLRTHPQAYSAYHDFRSGVPGGMGGG